MRRIIVRTKSGIRYLHGFYQIIAVENHYRLGNICEGKDPMNNQLYHLFCTWFIELMLIKFL